MIFKNLQQGYCWVQTINAQLTVLSRKFSRAPGVVPSRKMDSLHFKLMSDKPPKLVVTRDFMKLAPRFTAKGTTDPHGDD